MCPVGRSFMVIEHTDALFVGKQEANVDSAMAPPHSPCENPPDGILCQPAPSTIIVIVSGMCVMMLLVVIALMLLFCSHFQYSQEQQRRQREGQESGDVGSSDVRGGLNSSDNMVLVLLPGEKNPVTFARPSPLKEVRYLQAEGPGGVLKERRNDGPVTSMTVFASPLIGRGEYEDSAT